MASHYKTLRIKVEATDDEIRAAYKRLILTAHPDKGGSPVLFRQLQVAYETLRDPKLRKAYDQDIAAQRRKKLFKTMPPLQDVKAPVSFALPNGDEYIFETAPDRLRCRFRHGDVVEDVSSGQRGVVVGLSSTGLFWCHQGSDHAVPMQTFGGDKDIVVVFRSPTTPTVPAGCSDSFSSRTSAFTGRRPQAAERAASPTASSDNPGGHSPNTHEQMKAKARMYKQELLQSQRQRVIAALIKTLQRNEASRRQALVAEIDDYFAHFHSEVFEYYVNATYNRRGGATPNLASARRPSATSETPISRVGSFSAPRPMTPRPGSSARLRTSSIARPGSTMTRSMTPTQTRRSAVGAGVAPPPRTGITSPGRSQTNGPNSAPASTGTSATTTTTTTTSSSTLQHRYSVPINPRLVATAARRPSFAASATSTASMTGSSLSSGDHPATAAHSARTRSPLTPHAGGVNNAFDTKSRIARMSEEAAHLREEMKRASNPHHSNISFI